MFEKLLRTEVFRDPIYGYIKVDYKVIHDLIDTREFQRLRRVSQLSGVSEVFPTAEHSRFTHSLGAYEVAREILESVEGANSIDEYCQVLLLVTALLHDIGHGPYSHAFERVLSKSHEEIGCLIITSPDTDINKVLLKYNINPLDIKNILLDRFYYYSYKVMVYNFKDMDNYVELNDVIKNKKVKYLILFGSSITDFDKENYSDWALNNGLKTNIMYFARNSFVDFIKNNTEKFLNEIDESKIYISSSKNECDRYNLYCYELPDGNYLGYVNEIE